MSWAWTVSIMDDLLVVGSGPAGLLAAWVASSRGARVRVLAGGMGTTHLSPGWIGVLDTREDASADNADDLTGALERWIASHPEHPYAFLGLEALEKGIALLKEACAEAGLNYVGDLRANHRFPTALGALIPAALAPESFAAGDARLPGDMLIAGPSGWRDFYPKLCAENLARQGVTARGVYFDLPEAEAGSFDLTPAGLARLFERAEVRARVAAQLKAKLQDGGAASPRPERHGQDGQSRNGTGAARVGFPAVLGMEKHAEVWREMQDRLGLPVFEIPTLPPSVPGMRLHDALKRALSRSGVRIFLDMTVAHGLTDGARAIGVVVPGAARDATHRADRIILATGGLYGGGISSNRHGEMREAIFDLPLAIPAGLSNRSPSAAPAWFDDRFLPEQGHPVHLIGVRTNAHLQPVNQAGEVLLENVRIAGRLLAGYNPVIEGSTEGVWLASAYRAATL
jgi:glycerol-3-phosphate dehydrogenase subunit B